MNVVDSPPGITSRRGPSSCSGLRTSTVRAPRPLQHLRVLAEIPLHGENADRQRLHAAKWYRRAALLTSGRGRRRPRRRAHGRRAAARAAAAGSPGPRRPITPRSSAAIASPASSAPERAVALRQRALERRPPEPREREVHRQRLRRSGRAPARHHRRAASLPPWSPRAGRVRRRPRARSTAGRRRAPPRARPSPRADYGRSRRVRGTVPWTRRFKPCSGDSPRDHVRKGYDQLSAAPACAPV